MGMRLTMTCSPLTEVATVAFDLVLGERLEMALDTLPLSTIIESTTMSGRGAMPRLIVKLAFGALQLDHT